MAAIPDHCERCGKATRTTIVSMFNTQTICMGCKDKEKKRPDYGQAQAADRAAIHSGNYNYQGIGLGKAS